LTTGYIATDTYSDTYGFSIEASLTNGGYAPNKSVRLDHGPAGKSLIIQEDELTSEAVPNSEGGEIVFSFDSPSEVIEVTLFGAESGALVIVERSDGTSTTESVDIMESTDVKTIELNIEDAEKVTIKLAGVGAVSSIGICVDPSHHGNAPPPVETSGCPPEVELLDFEGETMYPDIPIVVTSQDLTTVSFYVEQTWSEEVVSIFSQFHEDEVGTTECYETKMVVKNKKVEYTAYCMKSVPITVVDLWVADVNFLANDTAVVPECCHPNQSGSSYPTVQYTFKIHCVAQCPTRRALGNVGDFSDSLKEYAKPVPNKHFCEAKDHACDEKSDHVHVCHYSSKRGYQTFCIPESDSDVLGHYPDDYCGLCVGGFGKSKNEGRSEK
jgi:hypothetical protein